MGLLRSEEMSHAELVFPSNQTDARKVVDTIGRSLNMQFEDMNSRDMRRPFRAVVQRIDEMERMLRYITSEIQQVEGCQIKKNKVDEFLAGADTYQLEAVRGEIESIYKNLVQSKEQNAKLLQEKSVAAEEKEVVSVAVKLLQGKASSEGSLTEPLNAIQTIAGVVPSKEEPKLRWALFRASRGNCYADFFEVPEPLLDPKTGEKVKKSVFVVIFQGSSKESPFYQKVEKVCKAMGVGMYNWPTDINAAKRKEAEIQLDLSNKTKALEGYQKFMEMEVQDLTAQARPGSGSKIEEWRLFCVKEKSIYTVMNLCSDTGYTLRVNVWFPSSDNTKVKGVLGPLKVVTNIYTKVKGTPPTYTKTNEFTEPWQDVINTYGIPQYQEANPALFAVVTFPFIFGMMYGDIGHGSMLLLVGIFLVQKGEQFKFTVPPLYGARYLVLQLGIFATFAGFMYNDLFSISLQLFPSGFDTPEGQYGPYVPNTDLTNSGGKGPYPFGLDWAWAGASNELLFVNSLKMKLSVLFGVLQMVVGVLIRWSNAVHQKNWVDFTFECVPMMVFMLCFFGWMDVMILYKWTHPIEQPPSIINSLICMAMGQEDLNPIYPGSVELSKTLMLWTVLSVPLMLFPKPFILLYQHQQAEKKKAADEEAGIKVADDEELAGGGGHGHGHGEEFEFGEIFIHQIIETIEYVLGTVSHTASYLRIWALSLAHQQLSLVFFQKTLTMGLEMSFPANGIVLYFMFAAWFGVTLGVLLGMDVLECFLHTLRLHWVEFQSKFYKAGGYAFEPYELKKLLAPVDE